jgi:hypothetical protein
MDKFPKGVKVAYVVYRLKAMAQDAANYLGGRVVRTKGGWAVLKKAQRLYKFDR